MTFFLMRESETSYLKYTMLGGSVYESFHTKEPDGVFSVPEWWAETSDPAKEAKLPKELWITITSGKFETDFQCHGAELIISDRLKCIVDHFNHGNYITCPVNIVTKKKKVLELQALIRFVERENVPYLNDMDIDGNYKPLVGGKNTLFKNEFGIDTIKRADHLIFKPTSKDIFWARNLQFGAIFCSERFRDHCVAQGIQGIEYLPLDDMVVTDVKYDGQGDKREFGMSSFMECPPHLHQRSVLKKWPLIPKDRSEFFDPATFDVSALDKFIFGDDDE